MKQLWIVMRETYLRQVKSWAFLAMLLAPFLFFGVTFAIGYFAGTSEEETIAVVTQNQSYKTTFSSYNTDYQTKDNAKEAMESNKIVGYIDFEFVDETLVATYHGKEALSDTNRQVLQEKLDELQYDHNIEQAALTTEQEISLYHKAVLTENVEQDHLQKTGQKVALGILPWICYFVVILYSSITATDIANEKGTRIMEVIFSSIPANLYFYGRVLGFIAVVVTHFAIYGIAIAIGIQQLPNFELTKNVASQFSPLIDAVIAQLNWVSILLVVVTIFLYIVFSVLCGTLVQRVEDAGKAVQPVLYTCMIGFFAALFFSDSGTDKIIIKVGSYIPLLSGFLMPIRLINGYASNGEGWLSIVILLLTTFLMIKIIGSRYSTFILQTEDIGILKTLRRGLKLK